MITTSVTEAAQCLKQGQVLAYPTEAVWGLGCDPYNEQAFLDILQIKQRPGFLAGFCVDNIPIHGCQFNNYR